VLSVSAAAVVVEWDTAVPWLAAAAEEEHCGTQITSLLLLEAK